MNIKRYNEGVQDTMFSATDGEWVAYADYLTQLERSRKALEVMTKIIDDLLYYRIEQGEYRDEIEKAMTEIRRDFPELVAEETEHTG